MGSLDRAGRGRARREFFVAPMPALLLLFGLAVIALVFGPQLWVQGTMRRHAGERPDFPGTGGELARHLLDEAGLAHVRVEPTAAGDHYDPADKAVRLSEGNYSGRSITAVAVAAHEVGHALQDRDSYRPLRYRQLLVAHAARIQRLGVALMVIAPLMLAVVRSPALALMQILAAFAIMGSTVLVHALTLPTELDASFRRAMPALVRYLPPEDLPAARSVLRAAAWTYVAAALVSLLDVARWFRILRP